jgi:hypothetical protein
MTSLEQQREDQALGAAWRRVEAALPGGCLPTVQGSRPDRPDGYCASVVRVGSKTLSFRQAFDGPTPTAALSALAEALEARKAAAKVTRQPHAHRQIAEPDSYGPAWFLAVGLGVLLVFLTLVGILTFGDIA